QRSHQRPRQPRDLDAHKGGRVDGDGPRRHLGDGDKVGEFRHGEPAVPVHDLPLEEGDGRIPAPEAEQPDLQKAPKQLQVDHWSPSFFCRWASRVRATPTAAAARITSTTFTPKKQVAAKAVAMMRTEAALLERTTSDRKSVV